MGIRLPLRSNRGHYCRSSNVWAFGWHAGTASRHMSAHLGRGSKDVEQRKKGLRSPGGFVSLGPTACTGSDCQWNGAEMLGKCWDTFFPRALHMKSLGADGLLPLLSACCPSSIFTACTKHCTSPLVLSKNTMWRTSTRRLVGPNGLPVTPGLRTPPWPSSSLGQFADGVESCRG